MKYLFFLLIIPFLVIPSAYADQKVLLDDDRVWQGAGVVGTTTSCAVAFNSNGTTQEVEYDNASIGGRCKPIAYQWNIDDVLPSDAIITNVILEFDIDAISATPMNCQIYHMDRNLWKHTGAAIWTDLNNGTQYASGETICSTTGNNKQIDLGSTAISEMQDQLTDTGIFGVSILKDPHTRIAGSSRLIELSDVQLYIEYLISLDGIDDLAATDVRATGVTLSWSPSITSGLIVGHQINNTTPHNENVASIIINDTGSASTTAVISGLTGSTDYSFRVAPRINDQLNATGNILNVTTELDPTQAFTAGTFNVTSQGSDTRNFKFQRIDVTDTDLRLNVTYPNSYNASCSFYYKFAMQNNTYDNLSDVPINANEDMASFLFQGVDNEIIDITCIDNNSGTTGEFLITQTQFMMLDLIDGFRAGNYGTDGKFGAIDFITIIVVLVSMLGFNRVNESVGIIFGVIVIGALSVFQIIEWQTTFTASMALVVLWAYTNTRKD